MQYNFGSGNFYGLVSSGGVNVPRKFGTLQDISVDFSFNLKELYGQLQFPVAIARGQGKIAGKAKNANFNANAFNDVFFGQTVTSGQALTIVGETATIPGTPYEVTVANAATFTEDLGVVYAATGVPLTRVAAGPATGEYSVAAGVYTFAAADTTLGVVIDYTYTPTAPAVGKVITLNNQLVGTTPTFVGVFNTHYNSKHLQLRLNACYSSKLSMASKIEDWMIPEFDFMASADAAGIIGTIGIAE